MSIEHWSLLISIFAIGVSLYTWCRTDKRDRDRRADEIREKVGASIQAHLNRMPTPGPSGKIIINNSGNGEARIQDVLIDGTPIQKFAGTIDPSIEHKIIGPNSLVKYELDIIGSALPHVIKIIWDDDYKSNRVYKNSLSV